MLKQDFTLDNHLTTAGPASKLSVQGLHDLAWRGLVVRVGGLWSRVFGVKGFCSGFAVQAFLSRLDVL